MGIFCEIKVRNPPNGEFIPGDQVRGTIKYYVDEEIVFKRITVSLKGIGRVEIVNVRSENNPRYQNAEHYVDIDQVDNNENEVATVPKTIYEKDFQFELPRNVPSTFTLEGGNHDLRVTCKIFFYLRIKFETGFLGIAKRFKKEIAVRPVLTPMVSREPLVITKQFKLITVGTDKTIDIKACMESPIIDINGTIRLSYEISNNTNTDIEGVKVKVKEITAIKPRGVLVDVRYKFIDGTSSKSGTIAKGATQIMDFELQLPPNVCTIQHWKEISRDYFVRIKILLPLFSSNREVYIPFQVGEVIEDRAGGFNAPPSYWEAMSECKKEWHEDDDAGD